MCVRVCAHTHVCEYEQDMELNNPYGTKHNQTKANQTELLQYIFGICPEYPCKEMFVVIYTNNSIKI